MRKYAYILSLLISCLAGTVGPVHGQYEEKNFTLYTVRDGLSDNLITSLLQDDQGYMWIGTDAGLNRFDGSGFKQYFRDTEPLKLLSGSIVRLKQFEKGQIAIVSRGGLQLLHTTDYTIKNFFVRDSTAISIHLNAAWDAIALPGERYAMSSAAGFYLFDKKGELLKRHDAFTIKDIGKKRILYGRDFFQVSGRKYMLFINDGGLALYDDSSKTYRELSENDPERRMLLSPPNQQDNYWTVRFKLDSSRFVFIRGGYRQIMYYNARLKQTTYSPLPGGVADSLSWESRFIRINDSLLAINSGINGFYLFRIHRETGTISTDGVKHLRRFKISSLFVDRDKRLWVGTNEGLLKQNIHAPVIQSWHYQPQQGQKFMNGFSAVFPYKNKLYVSRFSSSKGLSIIDPVSMRVIREIDFFSDRSSWNEIRSIEMYHPDTLWIGSNGGLLWFDTQSERYGKVFDENKTPWAKSFFPVLAPLRPDGYAWMCGFLGGKLVRYHAPTRSFTYFDASTTPALPFDKVKHIVYDAYGDVWIGGHWLTRWNNRKKYFDTLITVYGGAYKYNDDIVAMRADNNGSIWIHNSYNGLLEYKIREKKFVAYTMKEGLPSELVVSLSPVIRNKLWLAGNNQLSFFDIGKKQFTVYDYRDGLPAQKPSSRKIYYDSLSGCMYLCCNEYLVRLPAEPPEEKDLSSNLLIDEIRMGDGQTFYNADKPVRVSYARNNITLNFSVIDFEKSNYQYAWKLNNSSDWNSIGNQRSITLTNLRPGEYHLQIRASGKPGAEKIKEVSFYIKPPFWETAWFIILIVLLAGAIVWFSYRSRVRVIRNRAEIDKQLTQTEMKALQAQMNPHFIFNCLNSIREMILNNENKDASHYLSKFAHLIRITLDQSAHPRVSLRNTADYLQRYLELEKIRNSLLEFSIETDEQLDADETMIPPMLLQPFIENALWHGVSASNKRIHVRAAFKKEGDNLVCRIEDNGIGINQSLRNKPGRAGLHKPHGIENIRNRISLLKQKYGLSASVDVRDKSDIPGTSGTGTVVTIILPLENPDL